MAKRSDRTLVTGFLAFEGFEVNPSALLAERCGRRFELIEVSYAAVDRFIEQLDASSFDRWLMLGVAGKSSRLRVEYFGRNSIGQRTDVTGCATCGPIDPAGPMQLAGTLWTSPTFAIETAMRRPSHDAGDYLCNYIYYRALRRFDGAGKRIGFLHIPPLEKMALEQQLAEVQALLHEIESDEPPAPSEQRSEESRKQA
jgi:pyroglutamyl-peptidase